MNVQSKKKRSTFPRMLRERIIQEYLSGRKTGAMLGREHGIYPKTINKMVSRYKQKNSANFTDLIIQPIMPRTRVKTADHSALQAENEQLKRQLELAHLKIESYQIMGDILEEEYGIDLLKKAVAGQCCVSKKGTQKSACKPSANCSATPGSLLQKPKT
jgi:transposase-like protein